MTNNFIQIRDLMDFIEPNEFYFVQIIRRKKDLGNERKPSSTFIKSYVIESKIGLLEVSTDIITLCRMFNARAYIYMSKRNFKYISLKMSIQLLKQRDVAEYKSCKGMFDSICSKYYITEDRKWLVDVENTTIPINPILEFIETKCDPIDTKKIITTIPTETGYHIITKPFNLKTFSRTYPTIGVHRNNPTLLFIP